MTPTPSVPGPDPVETATQWLNLYQSCDLNCLENHPIAHSTVTGLHAVAATARIATAEARRERDEAQGRCRAVAVLLREMANRSSVPPAGLLRQLADQLEEGL